MKKTIVVDIDGTLANNEARLQALQNPNIDWVEFYNKYYTEEYPDEVVLCVLNLLRSIRRNYFFVYCTGRKECLRGYTQKFLDKLQLKGPLLMRGNHDTRHDSEVKPDLLEKLLLYPQDVAFILEDRNSMVKRWRELGYDCFQVAEGDF